MISTSTYNYTTFAFDILILQLLKYLNRKIFAMRSDEFSLERIFYDLTFSPNISIAHLLRGRASKVETVYLKWKVIFLFFPHFSSLQINSLKEK
jgi:hypothetical protein